MVARDDGVGGTAMSGKRLLPSDAMVDELDLPFWRACADEQFLVHRCDACGRAYWPASCCIDHGGTAMQWVPASGRGVVHTFTVFHHAYDPSLSDQLPYVIAVVRMVEGVSLLGRLTGVPVDGARVGMPVRFAGAAANAEPAVITFRPR